MSKFISKTQEQVCGDRLDGFSRTHKIDYRRSLTVSEEGPGTNIFTVPSLLTPQECEQIINLYKNNQQHAAPGTTLGGMSPNKHDIEMTISDRTEIDFLAVEELLRKRLWELRQAITPILRPYFTRPIQDSGFKFQHYKPAIHYYDWHVDAAPGRQLALLIYLNDVAEGGETGLWYQRLNVKPETGKALIFPANPGYPHCGFPPAKEDKYIVTSFFVDG